MAKRLWVVEHYWEHGKLWSPTVGVKLTRDEAECELRDWRAANPDDKFRVTPYVAAKGA